MAHVSGSFSLHPLLYAIPSSPQQKVFPSDEPLPTVFIDVQGSFSTCYSNRFSVSKFIDKHITAKCNKENVLLVGAHATGKSTLIRQACCAQ